MSNKLFPLLALAGAGFAFSKAFGAKKSVAGDPFRTDPFRPDTKWRRNLQFSPELYDMSKVLKDSSTLTPEGIRRLTAQTTDVIESILKHPCPPGYSNCGYALGDLLIYHPTLKMTVVADFKICSVNATKYYNDQDQPAPPFANREIEQVVEEEFLDESLLENSSVHFTTVLLIPRIRPSWHYADYWKGKSVFASSTDPIWTILASHESSSFQPATGDLDDFASQYNCPGYIDAGDTSTEANQKIVTGWDQFGRKEGQIVRKDKFLGRNVLIAQAAFSNLLRERLRKAGVKVEKS